MPFAIVDNNAGRLHRDDCAVLSVGSGEETLALACAEARRKNTRVNGRSGRKKQPVIPTRFRLAEGEAKTAAELYAKIIPVW